MRRNFWWVWVTVVLVQVLQANDDIINNILNWYQYSPASQSVDSCFGLIFGLVFAPEDGRLKSLKNYCERKISQTHPRDYTKMHVLFGMKWKYLDTPNSRVVKTPRARSRRQFNENFTDSCFRELTTCVMSLPCRHFALSPPGRRYFVTHQVLLSYAYRLKCEQDEFWTKLKDHEARLCGAIKKEEHSLREDWDLRMEQTMVCHMAGFKDMLSNQFEHKLPKEAKTFRKFGHDLACMTERESWGKAPKFKTSPDGPDRRLLQRRSAESRVARRGGRQKHGCDGHSTSLLLSNLLMMFDVSVH